MPEPRQYSRDSRDRHSYADFKLDKQKLTVILNGENAQTLVITAEEIAKNIKSVSTSQIRNIYGTVKNLESKGEVTNEVISKLILLKPQLAYAAGRHSDVPGMKILQTILSDAIDLVYEPEKQEKRFENFCKFFEAILAYHKAHGGK